MNMMDKLSDFFFGPEDAEAYRKWKAKSDKATLILCLVVAAYFTYHWLAWVIK